MAVSNSCGLALTGMVLIAGKGGDGASQNVVYSYQCIGRCRCEPQSDKVADSLGLIGQGSGSASGGGAAGPGDYGCSCYGAGANGPTSEVGLENPGPGHIGGPGGPGGQGGAGGDGGPSIGIALSGNSPTPPGIAFIYTGTPGGGGDIGAGGVNPNCSGATGNPGVAGGAGSVVDLDKPPGEALANSGPR